MKFYKQCYLSILITFFTILEMTQIVLATDCDTFSKIVKNMGKTVSGGAYVTFTDCCKATGVTCDANQNIVKLSFGEFSGYEGNINSFYQELQNLKSLTSLEIVDCKIGDYSQNNNNILPKTIGNIKNLKTLIIKDNYIDYMDSNLPEEIGNLINLEKLDLSGNKLSGSLPKSIGNLKNLKILNLNGNDFSDTIPYEFKNLQNLEEINLNGNSNLKGYVPPLPKLKSCDYAVSGLCKLPGSCGNNIKLCSSDDIKSINKRNGNPNSLDGDSSGSNTSIYNPTNYTFSDFNSSSYNSKNIDSSTSDELTNSVFKCFMIYIVASILFIVIVIITVCMCNKHAKKTKIDNHMKHRSVKIFINDIGKSSKFNNNVINDTTPLNLSYFAEDEPLPEYTPTEKPMVMTSSKNTSSNTPLKYNYSAYTKMNTSKNITPLVSVPPPALIVSPAESVPQSVISVPQLIITPPPDDSVEQLVVNSPPDESVPQLIITPPPDDSVEQLVANTPPDESVPQPIISVPQLIISPPPGESVEQLIVDVPQDESVPQIVVSAPPDESVSPVGYEPPILSAPPMD